MTAVATGPLEPGSVSVGLHPGEGRAPRVVDDLLRLARAAETAGFDGVTFSEHHGGHPGYLPVPLLMATRLLASLRRAWVAACPTILPLRDVAAVVEEVAWAAACWPGRIGLGVVPGYQERDFAVVGRPFGSRRERFETDLPGLTAALAGRVGGALGDDPAVAALRFSPVPVVSGVGGPRGVRHAATAGAGILITSLTPPDRGRMLVDTYRDAGGSGPVILIRRAWIGRLPAEAAGPLERYREAGLPGVADSEAGLAQIAQGSADQVVNRLAADSEACGADALNLRFGADVPTPVVEEQIRSAGEELVGPLKQALGLRVKRSEVAGGVS
jgi:alkanesulfonate monooxygenase SsuD/methylene tetrahydromethanopterin reductase-like flavin-dependent oxidoreductase (luciferase family)